MKLEENLMNFCPPSLRLPVKYYYQKARKRLEKEITYLNQLVGSGKRAIDIGANQGIYSYALAQLCEIVEVFEPQAWCTEAIVAYSKTYSHNINVYNVGLSDFNGSLTLHIPTAQSDYAQFVSGLGSLTTGLASFSEMAGDRIGIQVPVCQLDDYEFEDVSFIKIDVEGHESKVLKGAKNTISTEKPTILIEIEQRHLDGKPIEQVFEQITELGYEGSFLYKGLIAPISEFSYQKNQELFLNNLFHEDYIKNFIFTPIFKKENT